METTGRSRISSLGHHLILLLQICVAVSSASSMNTDYDCKGIRTRRHAQISSPPNISGSWYSPSCEMLPGPQYVLRQYEFSSTERFVITRYYYSDEFCREAAYAIQARGTVTADSRSWYLNEATDMNIDLTELVIKPYTSKMSSVLSSVLRIGCDMETNWTSVLSPPYKSAYIQNVRDQNCLESLSFSANELLVMRQVDYERTLTGEATTTQSHSVDSEYQSDEPYAGRSSSVEVTEYVERELQLGGVWFNQLQRPSSYQPPLYTATHKHCEACPCIYRSDMDNPPVSCSHHRYQTRQDILSSHPNISGHWFSQTCESVPNALFTLRSYLFNDTDHSFNITTHYFTDTFCTKATFMLNTRGKYIAGEDHPRLYNTKSYQLIFASLHVTILSEYMLELMKLGDSSLCGHVTSWSLSQPYDVTSTGGCDTLGVSIHENSESHVLIKVEQHPHSDFVLLSEIKSNPSDFYTKITHFSSKLKRCKTVPKRWVHYDQIQDSKETLSSAVNCQSLKSLLLFGVVISGLLHNLIF